MSERYDENLSYLCNVVPVASDDTGHEVVMAGQVFCRTVVDDVCTMLEGPLQSGAHHSVVYDDEGIGTALLDVLCDAGEIDDLEEGVCGRLEEDHGDVVVGKEEGGEGGGVGCVDVVYGDALVCLEVGKETVRATVEVVTSDDGIGGLEETEDCVKGGHARGDGKCMGCGGNLCEMVLCGRMSGERGGDGKTDLDGSGWGYRCESSRTRRRRP